MVAVARRQGHGLGEAAVPFKRGQLDYFVTVAQEGQMTRAAAKLQMAQPALSQAIAGLEVELGFTLFERHARGVTLTPAGNEFYKKARKAVAAATEARETAESLARGDEGTIVFGFLGSPPALDSPGAVEAFAEAHPGINIRYQELPFPFTPTSSWLSQIDVAACHQPAADPKVWAHTLRLEPRTVLASTRHPLATRNELTLAETIDETFVGFHPSVEPAWAGFWSLDDHRGGPPRRVTDDHAANPQEVLASLLPGLAITTVPASIAPLLATVMTGLLAIPLRDADPTAITLVGHTDRRNQHVQALVSFAANLAETPSRAEEPNRS
jgi:DNA-binding transcriptional LysR family regulator